MFKLTACFSSLLLLIAMSTAQVGCSGEAAAEQSRTDLARLGYYNSAIQKATMPDGTVCYVATESGHGLAMQCFREGGAK